jgi:2-isopropylmalate synthase
MREIPLQRARLVAFGSTRRFQRDSGKPAAETTRRPAGPDKTLQAILASGAQVVCLFGKTWDLHVRRALRIGLEDNLELIRDSMAFFAGRGRRVFFDAEHFFDGYKDNPRYALACLKVAAAGGAELLVLCDTNGGSLPDEIGEIVRTVKKRLGVPLGIHCHNDGELAVANSLAAVASGAVQVQGTINGIGERCGNANLVSVMANLELKRGYRTIGKVGIRKLTEVSRYVDAVLNRHPDKRQAFVGESAFAHKGGVHINAVLKDSKTYEHVNPTLIGNDQRILLSDLSGQAAVRLKIDRLGLAASDNPIDEDKLLTLLKERERQGYQYEDAEASFAILVHHAQKKYRTHFELLDFKVVDIISAGSGKPRSDATLHLRVGNSEQIAQAQGVGPVNALDHALRKCLTGFYPHLEKIRLVDYKVRVLASGQGTESMVRVHIEFSDGVREWNTVGVSENIIQASYTALVDGIDYYLLSAPV